MWKVQPLDSQLFSSDSFFKMSDGAEQKPVANLHKDFDLKSLTFLRV